MDIGARGMAGHKIVIVCCCVLGAPKESQGTKLSLFVVAVLGALGADLGARGMARHKIVIVFVAVFGAPEAWQDTRLT